MQKYGDDVEGGKRRKKKEKEEWRKRARNKCCARVVEGKQDIIEKEVRGHLANEEMKVKGKTEYEKG